MYACTRHVSIVVSNGPTAMKYVPSRTPAEDAVLTSMRLITVTRHLEKLTVRVCACHLPHCLRYRRHTYSYHPPWLGGTVAATATRSHTATTTATHQDRSLSPTSSAKRAKPSKSTKQTKPTSHPQAKHAKRVLGCHKWKEAWDCMHGPECT